MMNRANHIFARHASILLVLLLLLSSLPLSAFSAEPEESNKTHFTITGSYEQKFELSSKDSKLFHLGGILPGDSWTGQIHIKNKAPDKMAVSLLSIVSNLEDMVLFNAMVLDISIDGETVYSGSYNPGKTPVLAPRYVLPNKTLVLDITVSLPLSVGNIVMNKEMDATWTFEATYEGKSLPDAPDSPDSPNLPDSPEYPDSPDSPQTGDDTNLGLLVALPLISLIGLIILLLYDRAKKKEKTLEEIRK